VKDIAFFASTMMSAALKLGQLSSKKRVAVSCRLRALEFDVMKLHLAVLDFAMPALNGFQLLLRLRATHASFPIVLLSGMSRDVPNNMRRVFSSCLDKGEPIDRSVVRLPLLAAGPSDLQPGNSPL
jgi:CheY-like chemotaxis protein